MTYTKQEVLTQLRRVVESAPDDLLHMRSVVEKAECGTARCALGWCLVDPWFIKNTYLGRLKAYEDRSFPLNIDLPYVFGINDEDANLLFAGDASSLIDEHAISKAEVLWNIDELLAGGCARPYAAVSDTGECVHHAIIAGGEDNPDYVVDDEDGNPVD